MSIMKGEFDRWAGITSTQLNHPSRMIQKNRKTAVVIVCIFFLLYGLRSFSRPEWSGIRKSPVSPLAGAEQYILGTSSGGKQHPIEVLNADAKKEFAAMVAGQSKTLAEASTEYQRRYNRPPPPGFDVWFTRAIRQNATIIDNFDTVMTTLEPFWRFAPQEIRTRARLAIATHNQMSHVAIKNHTSFVSEDSDKGHTDVIVQWLEPILQFLPDMELAVSDTDEPRVVVPHDELQSQQSPCVKNQNILPQRGPFEFTEIFNQDVWRIATMSCAVDSPSRSSFLPKAASGIDVLFLKNVSGSKDICQTPNAATQHGLFVSPNSLKFSNALLPIFGRSTVSSFQDLLLPATDYTNTYASDDFEDPTEPPWEQKANQLYWTGASRDGHAHKGKWRLAQRWRFVGLANDGNQQISLLGQTQVGAWQMYRDTMSSLSHLFAVKFTRQMACEPEDCEAQTREYAFGEMEPVAQAYRSRFVFDLDGHAFTERFYRLLSSHSTVLKQTIFREWHDDRLIPWYHYVPISLGMEELPETVRFLASPQGEQISREIAEQGREWQKRALSKSDIELCFHRIMLEYARLLSDEREDYSQCPP